MDQAAAESPFENGGGKKYPCFKVAHDTCHICAPSQKEMCINKDKRQTWFSQRGAAGNAEIKGSESVSFYSPSVSPLTRKSRLLEIYVCGHLYMIIFILMYTHICVYVLMYVCVSIYMLCIYIHIYIISPTLHEVFWFSLICNVLCVVCRLPPV